MATFTSSLPDELLLKLHKSAASYSVPKNKLIEKALSIYLDQLERGEYIKSFKRAAHDPDVLLMAEEGMKDYLKQIDIV